MTNLRKAAQAVISWDDWQHENVSLHNRMPLEYVQMSLSVEALRQALQAEPSIDALIADIDGLGLHDTYVNFKDIRTILDKYRSYK